MFVLEGRGRGHEGVESVCAVVDADVVIMLMFLLLACCCVCVVVDVGVNNE